MGDVIPFPGKSLSGFTHEDMYALDALAKPYQGHGPLAWEFERDGKGEAAFLTDLEERNLLVVRKTHHGITVHDGLYNRALRSGQRLSRYSVTSNASRATSP